VLRSLGSHSLPQTKQGRSGGGSAGTGLLTSRVFLGILALDERGRH